MYLHDIIARDRPDLGLIAGDTESGKRWFASFGIEYVTADRLAEYFK